jgi:hypothetical protein
VGVNVNEAIARAGIVPPEVEKTIFSSRITRKALVSRFLRSLQRTSRAAESRPALSGEAAGQPSEGGTSAQSDLDSGQRRVKSRRMRPEALTKLIPTSVNSRASPR